MQKAERESLALSKVPPHADDIEHAVLGAMLNDRSVQDVVFEIIQDPDIFYGPVNQLIFTAMLSLYNKGNVIDLVTVTDQLNRLHMLEDVGGAHHLTGLAIDVVSTAHVDHHARLLIEKFMGRGLVKLGGTVYNAGFDQSLDVFDAMDYAETELDKLKNKVITKPYHHVSAGVKQVQGNRAELIARDVEFTGVNTGFAPLNEKTNGWQPSNVIIVAARPAVGKTAFTINTVLQCAADPINGGPAAMFNLEMNVDELTKRMISCISGVSLDHINKPKLLMEKEKENLAKAEAQLAMLKIFIDDTPGLSMTELRSKSKQMKRKHGIKLLVLDYLQLMTGDNKSGNREQEIAKISRDLKKLAKELEIPIIALSQLNRDVDKENRAPELSDLRESGSIEQDADMVMFLYRPNEKSLKAKPELRGKILGAIKKNRHGECADVVFHVDNRIQRWLDQEPSMFTGPGAAELEKSYLPETINNDDLPF